MLILAHIGIGTKLVSPWSRGLSRAWLIFGILLPDLLDKPLYYIPVLLGGNWGDSFGIISGTRTFGHTGLLLLCVILWAILKKSKIFAAISLGEMTHLLLDSWVDYFNPSSPASAHFALLFPAYGFQFPIIPSQDKWRHLASYTDPYLLACEGIGLAIILWDLWKKKNLKLIMRKR